MTTPLLFTDESTRTGRSASTPQIRSVYSDQTDILRAIQKLHICGPYECDATYGNGSFWRHIERPNLAFDSQPLFRFVECADFGRLPIDAGHLGNIVIDPPFLTYVKSGRHHKGGAVAMTKRFGGYYTYEQLEDDYRDAVSEAFRVLKRRGVLVFKCQDIIHNHRMHCTHAKVIAMAELEGFRLLDLFVLTAKHRMPGPQKGTQRHARIWHSYFLVFKKP
jgi:hypothetical protein